MSRAIWWRAQFDTSNGRARRALVATWATPGAAARVLEATANARRLAGVFKANPAGAFVSPTLIGSADWRATTRSGAMVRARDLLYGLKQARAAGVLRVRVPS